MTNNGFVEYILDILSNYGNIRSRRMFGGYGIYLDKIIIGIIIDSEIYFKVDSNLVKKYKSLGSYPFTYKRGNKTISLSYWLVPPEILEDNDQLKDFFDRSLEIAKNNKKRK